MVNKKSSSVQKIDSGQRKNSKLRDKDYTQGMEFSSWEQETFNRIEWIEKNIVDPEERLHKLENLEEEAKNYSEPSWITPEFNRRLVTARVKAKRDIRKREFEKKKERDVYIVEKRDPEQEELGKGYNVEIRDALTNELLDVQNIFVIQPIGEWNKSYFNANKWTLISGEYNDRYKFAIPRVKYLFEEEILDASDLLDMQNKGLISGMNDFIHFQIMWVFPTESHNPKVENIEYPEILTEMQENDIKDFVMVELEKRRTGIETPEKIYNEFYNTIQNATEFFQIQDLRQKFEGLRELAPDQKSSLNILFDKKLVQISEATFQQYKTRILSPQISIEDLKYLREKGIQELPTYKRKELLQLINQTVEERTKESEEKLKSMQEVSIEKEKRPLYETSYYPFSKDQIDDYNRYSHYTVDINADFEKTIKQKEQMILEKLGIKDLVDIPSEIKTSLNYYRKYVYQSYLARSRSRAIAPPWSVVGRTKYSGHPERARRIEEKAYEELKRSEEYIDRGIKKIRETQAWAKPVTVAFDAQFNSAIRTLRSQLKKQNIILEPFHASGSSKGKKWKMAWIRVGKKIYDMIINESGQFELSDLHNPSERYKGKADTPEKIIEKLKDMILNRLLNEVDTKK